MTRLALVVMGLVLITCGRGAPSMHKDQENFRKRIGLDALPDADAPSGVVLDWSGLSDLLRRTTPGTPLEFRGAGALEAGLSLGRWFWNDDHRNLHVSAYVSGRGARAAREKFLDVASATMMRTIPYTVGPGALGDLSIHVPGHEDRAVLWVFKNVFVEIESEPDSPPVGPIARQLQDWMASHVVPRLADYLPRVERVEAPSSRIRVGQVAEVHVRLAAGVARESLLAEIDEVEHRYLEPGPNDGLNALFTGLTPGEAKIDLRITDPKTLLSPPLPKVTVTVLPAVSP